MSLGRPESKGQVVTWKGQVQYFVEQLDTFGPEWWLKFSVTPVIESPFLK